MWGKRVGARFNQERLVAIAVSWLVLRVMFSPVIAQATDNGDANRFEVFSGADVTSNSVFGYFGGSWALGRDVVDQGLRVKLLAGTGRYDYETTLPGALANSVIKGDVGLLELLAGYQWQRGKWTLKGYAGVSLQDHDLTPDDPSNMVNGRKVGVSGQLEVWRNLGSRGFISFDTNYSSAFNSYFAQGRLGRRFTQRVSAGIEGAALGNEEYESGRGGGFLRFHLGAAEVTLSAGASGDYYSGDAGGYGALGLYRKF